MLPISYNNKVTDAHLLLDESSVKSYTKNHQVSCFQKITKQFANSRIIKSLPKGAIGFIAGAGIGAITIEVIHLISFSLINKEEKNLASANIVLSESMAVIKILYAIVCATLGYYIELENCHKSSLYRI